MRLSLAGGRAPFPACRADYRRRGLVGGRSHPPASFLAAAALALASPCLGQDTVARFPIPESELTVPDKPLLMRYVKRGAKDRCDAHRGAVERGLAELEARLDRKSTRLNSSH